ncbi:hypothetical protein LSTR_LSTR005038 [Laodelphax striatellus]|uniref:dolichyl-phosphate-mannose--protein mannosyltransferase n=1 Tax=Laodelphax striatellus TaxID=195883 RepID=A0A482WSY3_LAOST|nr:hypothetical protein LSTR_LSTR005038 [Laodelphax striatellus]
MNLDAIICFISAVIYHNTLDAGFVYDDSRAILSNPDVHGSTPWKGVWTNDFWGTPLTSSGSHGSYRPLCVLSFRATYWACGFKPWGYHALNILLHSLATGLVLKVGRRLLPCRGANAAGMLFAVHPIHSEAVAGIVGRADLLACVFFLLSFLAYLKHVQFRDARAVSATPRTQKPSQNFKKRHYFTALCRDLLPTTRRKCLLLSRSSDLSSWEPHCDSWLAWGFLLASILLAALAMLSKETGITVLALCAVFELSRLRTWPPSLLSRRSVSLISLGAAVLVLVCLRLHVMGMRPPSFASCDNPTARTSSWLVRLLTFLYLPAFNFKLLLWPQWLSYDWSMEAIPRVSSIFDPRNLITIAVYTLLFRCLKLGSTFKNKSLLMCLAFLIIPFLPATNLFFYVGFVVAERVLYIPSVGFCFLVGLGYHLLLKKADFKLIRLCFVMMLVVLGARTHHRNRDWTDEESLYRSGIPINPPKSWGNLGSVLSSQGRMEEAEYAFRKALEFRPNMADVHYNLGILQQGKGQYNEAIVSYQMAIKFRPSLALAHLNLGQLLASRGRCEEAEAVLRRCSQLDGAGLKDQRTHYNTRISALVHLGRMLSDRGHHSRAVDVYREAVHSMPEHYQPQTLYNLLGEELGKMGNHEEAERWFKAALDASPDHVPAHLTYGKLLAKNRTRAMEAELWFKKAQQLAPSDPAVYTHFGDFLGGLERHVEAAKVLLRGAEMVSASQQLPLVSAAATALRQAGRLSHAESIYRRALALNPKDATSHSNLGAILHLNGKYPEAAEAYREALRLHPNDATTLSNLRKLRSLMNNPVT